MSIPEYLFLDNEPAKTDTRRQSKYDRDPVAVLFFTDSKSRAFWTELPATVTSDVVAYYDIFRSKSGPMPEGWLIDSFFMALEDANDWGASLPDEDPNVSAGLLLEKLIEQLRREFGQLEDDASHHSFTQAMLWAFRRACYYKEAPDAAS